MAFSRSLALLVLCLTFFSGCFADLIGDVCSKAQNPSLCNDVLRSAHNRAPDLKTLGGIAFSYAEEYTIKLQGFLRALSNAATDNELKRRYRICLGNIDFAHGRISSSHYYFLAKDYLKMRNDVRRALNAGALCDRLFHTPPYEATLLKQVNQRAIHLTSIVAAVANALTGH